MSIINRNNYEIYFLDYLEGNLSPELKREMDLFLINNPDLKEELDGLDDAVLPDEKIIFTGKESLKNISLATKPGRFLTDDDFMIAKIEGDLTPEEEIVFESYIKSNSLVEKEYSLYKLTKLQADESIVFENKESLKFHQINLIKEITERPARFASDDEFLVAKIEGDLLPKEEIVFESYLKENSAIEKEYTLFKLTKLEPDESIRFDQKASLTRFDIPSRYHELRNYSYAIASVAAVFLFIVFFFNEKEENTISPENANYLSLIHRSARNNDNDLSENKISFTGTSIANEKENEITNMEIKVQKNLHANLNNTTSEDKILKDEAMAQNDKVVIDENFNPDNLHNIQTKGQIEVNNTPEKQIQNNNTSPGQPVNKTVQPQKVKNPQKKDNSNFSFWKVASMGIRGLSNLTGKKMELNEKYDANGNVKSLAFNSSKLEISAPVKKK